MNTTDLRDELVARTEGLQADVPLLSSGVAGRVRAIRRRRALTGSGVAAVLAVAVGIISWPAPRSDPGPARPTASTPVASSSRTIVGPDGMPFRTVPDAPGDVVKDGLRFGARVGDDTLAAGLIGDVGQRALSASWTPTTSLISYVAECWLPVDSSKEVIEGTLVRASIAGIEGSVESSCDVRAPRAADLPAGAYVPGEPGQGHPELMPGVAARPTVELVDPEGRPTSVPGARLAAAVYELGPQAQVLDEKSERPDVVLPEVVEHQGYLYRLQGVATGPLGNGALPRFVAPAGTPLIVAWGSQVLDASDRGQHETAYSVAGLGDAAVLGLGVGTTQPHPGFDSPTALTVERDGSEPSPLLTGVTYLGIYTLDD